MAAAERGTTQGERKRMRAGEMGRRVEVAEDLSQDLEE